MNKWIFRMLAVSLFGALALPAQTPPKPEGEKPEAPKEKAFAEVIKDAKVTKGMFTFYRTEDQVFLEILPSQFDKLYMLSLTCETGLGE